MFEKMTHLMIFVRDYEEALDFYTNKLGFKKVSDVNPGKGWRFLTVAPKGEGTEVIFYARFIGARRGRGQADEGRDRQSINNDVQGR